MLGVTLRYPTNNKNLMIPTATCSPKCSSRKSYHNPWSTPLAQIAALPFLLLYARELLNHILAFKSSLCHSPEQELNGPMALTRHSYIPVSEGDRVSISPPECPLLFHVWKTNPEVFFWFESNYGGQKSLFISVKSKHQTVASHFIRIY